MWTFMVRDRNGSKDGWFWGYHGTGDSVDGNDYPFNYPNAGFGQYCIRCHASAEDMFTFSALRNIAGEDGNPVAYYVDNSWMPAPDDDPDAHAAQADDPDPAAVAQSKPERALNAEFAALFNMLPTVSPDQVRVHSAGHLRPCHCRPDRTRAVHYL